VEAFVSERLTMLEALVPPRERVGMAAAPSDLEETRRSLTELLQAEREAA
jgi:hypothetical protein